MVTRGHATNFIGQHVVFRTTNGLTHHGILQSATNEGIYVRSIDGRGTALASSTDSESSNFDLIQNLSQSENDTEEAFFPFFFFPFFALAFLGPWAWWW